MTPYLLFSCWPACSLPLHFILYPSGPACTSQTSLGFLVPQSLLLFHFCTLGLTPVGNSAPPAPGLQSSPVGWGENQKNESEKTHGLRYREFDKERSCTCTNKVKQGINSLLPLGKQVFDYPYKSRDPSHIMIIWENKYNNSNNILLSFSPQTLMLSMIPYGIS